MIKGSLLCTEKEAKMLIEGGKIGNIGGISLWKLLLKHYIVTYCDVPGNLVESKLIRSSFSE